MLMKKIALFLAAILVAKIAVSQQYVITASITGFKNGTKFYLKDVDADANIDSAVIQNDHFVLKGVLAETPQNLWLYSQNQQNFYYATLLIGNEKVSINGDIKDFPFDLSISGGKAQQDHDKLIDLTKAGYKHRNDLLAEYFALKGDSAKIKSKIIWTAINKIDSLDEVTRKAFIKANLNSYEGLLQLFFVEGKYQKDSLQQMYNSLGPQFKQCRFGQRINSYLKVGDILKKGDDMADFEAIDKSGKKHKLSEIKGEYILLDFSTTYCGPCIESVAELKEISKQYTGKLAVVTFSADGSKTTWLKGIDRDKPSWLSVWDGKGDYGETISKYGVTGYPTFFLVDPHGKILSKVVGYGKSPGEKSELEKEVDKFLYQKDNSSGQ
jgi:thiol-disulfide isomerase/thioredoxin